MTRWLPLAGAIALMGVMVAGVTEISRRRLGAGELYGAYSSLRAEPDGTQALFDSLSRLPGFVAERGLRPLAAIEPGPSRLLLFIGLPEGEWRELDEDTVAAVERAVAAGSRAVVAFQTNEHALPADLSAHPEPPAAEKQWGAALEAGGAKIGANATPEKAIREKDAPAWLPASLAWESGNAFTLQPEAGWRILYRRDFRPVIVERAEGRGTVVLCADASFLTNDALVRHREPRLLAWVVGTANRAVFDETHLGVTESTGVAALARRYGLTGALLLLVGVAALAIWRKMALFLPLPEEEAVVAPEYEPTAGLEILLRRSIPARELTAACLAEWQAAGRPGQIGAAAFGEAATGASPAETYNARRAALRRARNTFP